jgi:hypothetical protein
LSRPLGEVRPSGLAGSASRLSGEALVVLAEGPWWRTHARRAAAPPKEGEEVFDGPLPVKGNNTVGLSSNISCLASNL